MMSVMKSGPKNNCNDLMTLGIFGLSPDNEITYGWCKHANDDTTQKIGAIRDDDIAVHNRSIAVPVHILPPRAGTLWSMGIGCGFHPALHRGTNMPQSFRKCKNRFPAPFLSFLNSERWARVVRSCGNAHMRTEQPATQTNCKCRPLRNSPRLRLLR